MNIQHAKRMDAIPEYIFSKLNKIKAETEKQSGKKVKDLGIGSPDIKPSKIYVEKLQELITQGDAHKYPGYGPIPKFREALINWHQKRFSIALDTDEVYQLNGAKDAISLLPFAFLNPEDEILIPDPGYQGYEGPALLAGAKPIFYSVIGEQDAVIDFDELQKLVTSKTKCMWVNFPSNPTGQVADLQLLEKLVTFAKANNIMLFYDNAYSEISFDGYAAPSILQVNGAKEVAIEINSFSKSYSFAGYRMGWIVGNKTIIAKLAKLKSQMDSGMHSFLQKLGAYALLHPDHDWHQALLKTYAKRRVSLASFLNSLGLHFMLPKASLYVWAKIPEATTSWDYCMRLLEEKQLLLTPGSAFGKNGEGYIRASIASEIETL